jgi:hypothetical protein
MDDVELASNERVLAQHAEAIRVLGLRLATPASRVRL